MYYSKLSDAELSDALVGLYAYDTGCVDSGIHDEILRGKVKLALFSDPLDDETIQKLEKLIEEERHIIQFTSEGWTIAHPLRERLNLDTLFDCRIVLGVRGDPGIRGRFWLNDDGSLGGPYG